MVATPLRGEIYWTQLDPVDGAEIGTTRPTVIIQNDVGNHYSSTTIVAAISSRYADRDYPFLVAVPEGVLPRHSVVNCAQLRTVDKKRLASECLGVLGEDTMRSVDEALRVSLSLG